MSTSVRSLLLAALPLALAAPHKISGSWSGCDPVGNEPCAEAPPGPAPTWSHGPYLPSNGSSDSGLGPTATGTGVGTAPWGTGSTGYTLLPTGTADGSGIMSILPIALTSSTSLYTYPLLSTSSTSSEEPIGTISPPSSVAPTPPPSSEASTPPNFETRDDAVIQSFQASTTFTFDASSTLPSGLNIATDFIASEPLTHTFAESNVVVEDGFLVLNVPGGQGGSADISSAEVSTDFSVQYGSIRTWAILTEEPGVCNGMFFYQSDSQETDIEWISDPTSLSNIYANNGTRALQYTNQALNGNPEDASSKFGRAPDDATSAVHEYRIDWFEDRTDFYLDGVFQDSITENVPSESGPWVWNNWANGDKGWTVDPPKQDAPFKIQRIEMYYNPA